MGERGTEAAADYELQTGGRGCVHDLLTRGGERFDADRPFLFVVRENGSNTIIFIGRVTRPSPYEPPASNQPIYEPPRPALHEPQHLQQQEEEADHE